MSFRVHTNKYLFLHFFCISYVSAYTSLLSTEYNKIKVKLYRTNHVILPAIAHDSETISQIKEECGLTVLKKILGPNRDQDRAPKKISDRLI
jgi:hypothetical protein